MHKGQMVAAVLAGSWRSSNYPPLEIAEADLDEITPLLCKSGAAALAWRRIKETPLADTAAAEVLHQTYRHQSLKSALHEQHVEKVFRICREADVEALIVKGWAAAILYEQNDLRPAGDIDLCVRPEHFDKADAALKSPEASDCFVDLHTSLSEIGERSFEDLLKRSILVPLGAEQARTLGTEDHLALLCIHLLKHGAWRPLWLCDISAAIEALPPRLRLGPLSRQQPTARALDSMRNRAGRAAIANGGGSRAADSSRDARAGMGGADRALSLVTSLPWRFITDAGGAVDGRHLETSPRRHKKHNRSLAGSDYRHLQPRRPVQ